MECLEAVDHDNARMKLLEQPIDGVEDATEAGSGLVVEVASGENVAEVFVDDAPVADGGRIEELEGLTVTNDLVEGFRHGGQVERGLLLRRVVECVLLAKDGLAAAGNSDEEVDGIAQQPPTEDLVKPLVAARKSFDQRVTSAWRAERTRALVPSRSRTVETSRRGSSGFARKAAAPACNASSGRSSEETASTSAPFAANSAHSPKPAPPEIRRSITTRSGDLSWKSARAS